MSASSVGSAAHHHVKCLNTAIAYLGSSVFRAAVPIEKISWSANYPDYRPLDYSWEGLGSAPWADPGNTSGLPFNALDEGRRVDRRSHEGSYRICPSTGRPLNPHGRTGLAGRGRLGRWGPNHAADPVVTRRHPQTGRLQFVAIRRKDTGEWALPGGMVDPGEQVSVTLRREFQEEAVAGGVGKEALEGLFASGRPLYAGYVDDPRNTDNAWMETVCVNFHDSHGLLANVKLEAGDDAAAVRWIDADDPGLMLYASHESFIEKLRQAHAIETRKA